MSSFKGKPPLKAWTLAQETTIAPMGYYLEVRGTKTQLKDVECLLHAHVIYIGRGQSQHRSIKGVGYYNTEWRTLDYALTPTKATLFEASMFEPAESKVRHIYFKTYIELCYFLEEQNVPYVVPQASIDLTPVLPRIVAEAFI